MTSPRQLKFGVFMLPPGHHIAAWRLPDAPTGVGTTIDMHLDLARTAERGLLDMVFLADTSAVPRGTADELSYNANRTFQFEPTTVISAIAQHCPRIGLIATMSTTYNEPFTVARKFATLDHLSHGRAGWNLVTSRRDEEGMNFNRAGHMEHGSRYDRAREFIDVVRGLWDSWDDDALVRDKDSGHYFRPESMHVLDHKGEHFQVRGPLNVPRGPQGHPIVVQAGSSDDGRQLAAETADLIFTAQNNIKDAAAFYSDVKSRVEGAGRPRDSLKIMPGLSTIIGDTEEKAHAKFQQLQDLIHPVPGLTHLAEMIGDFDLTPYPLDGPLPELPKTNSSTTRQRLIIEMAHREGLTIRQLYQRIAGNRAHAMMIGTPSQIADEMEAWFKGEAADGFNLIPPTHDALALFVDKVVPELQKRGLFRTEYEGETLRDRLGLARPDLPYEGAAPVAQPALVD